MRPGAAAVVLAGWAIGCGAPPGIRTADEAAVELELGRRYVEDSAFRRQVLEDSLVNPDNGYSQLRLGRYTDDDWGALPVWKPELAPEVPWTRQALLEAGRTAFFEYPVQIAGALGMAVDDPEVAARYGAHHIVRTEVPDGPAAAFACATCHTRDDPDDPRPGIPNQRLDYGAMLDDFYVRRTASSDWGPGRVDVSPDSTDNPTAICDLRALSHQEYLQKTGSVRNGLIEMAVRTETQIITSLGQAARPPRQTAFAITLFVRSLADELPPAPAPGAAGALGQGRALFDTHCASCHAGESMSGGLVPLAEIGTDPTVGESATRETGAYRIPSLHGVGTRGRLLSNGGVPDLQTLMDPDREAAGHTYGLSLTAPDRAALLEFLAAL